MNRNLAPALLVALFTVVLVLATGLFMPALGRSTAMPSLASMPRTLSVAGQGFVDIPKTVAQVQLGVETQQETAVAAQTEIAQRSAAVVQLLKQKSAVKKLDTTGVTLNPVYSFKDNEQKLTGYQGTNLVRFQIDPAAIGGLLDEAVKLGASRIDGVTLVASDEAIAEAENSAIAQATQQARRQADSALGSLQLRQQEVVAIRINNAAPPQGNDLLLHQESAMSLADPMPKAASPIVAGEQRVAAVVTLQVRY
ncbi:MAG: SIMPL domain-containing protein [Synechococcales cyanobacterium RM1_1_8]|nr:SIMPL domain-containing protein [Synechococcales cyanobacterium RM1_1_8]